MRVTRSASLPAALSAARGRCRALIVSLRASASRTASGDPPAASFLRALESSSERAVSWCAEKASIVHAGKLIRDRSHISSLLNGGSDSSAMVLMSGRMRTHSKEFASPRHYTRRSPCCRRDGVKGAKGASMQEALPRRPDGRAQGHTCDETRQGQLEFA